MTYRRSQVLKLLKLSCHDLSMILKLYCFNMRRLVDKYYHVCCLAKKGGLLYCNFKIISNRLLFHLRNQGPINLRVCIFQQKYSMSGCFFQPIFKIVNAFIKAKLSFEFLLIFSKNTLNRVIRHYKRFKSFDLLSKMSIIIIFYRFFFIEKNRRLLCIKSDMSLMVKLEEILSNFVGKNDINLLCRLFG